MSTRATRAPQASCSCKSRPSAPGLSVQSGADNTDTPGAHSARTSALRSPAAPSLCPRHALLNLDSTSLYHESASVSAQSCPTLDWDSPGQNTGVGSLGLLQGIFPTQELFAGGSSWLRNRTGASCIAGGFLTGWAIGEAHPFLPWENEVRLSLYHPRGQYAVWSLRRWLSRTHCLAYCCLDFSLRAGRRLEAMISLTLHLCIFPPWKWITYREKQRRSYRYRNFRPYSVCQGRCDLRIICSAVKYSFGSSRWVSEVEKFFCLRWGH